MKATAAPDGAHRVGREQLVPHRSVLPGLSLAAAPAILRLVDRAAGALPEPGTTPHSRGTSPAQVTDVACAPSASKTAPRGQFRVS